MTDYIERYWRDATPQDAIKEPPMVARFRNHKDSEWYISNLFGIDRAVISGCLWCGGAAAYHQCQVYDAPDPGEGWRLVDPEKESPEEGDELFAHGYWKTRRTKTDPFAKTFYYRRRIEPPQPKYEPFRWEDREQLRGRWVVDAGGEQEHMISDFWLNENGFYISGHPAEYFVDWRFLDTGEPVGRRVEQ